MYDSDITSEEVRKEIDKAYHKLHLLQSLFVAKFDNCTQRVQHLVDQLNYEEESKLLKGQDTRPIDQTPRDLIMALGQLSFDEEYQISFIYPPSPMAFLVKELVDHPSFHIMLTQGDVIIKLN